MPRKLPHTLSTKLASSELKLLQSRAQLSGLTQSEYLRLLVLAEVQSVNEQSLLQAAPGARDPRVHTGILPAAVDLRDHPTSVGFPTDVGYAVDGPRTRRLIP